MSCAWGRISALQLSPVRKCTLQMYRLTAGPGRDLLRGRNARAKNSKSAMRILKIRYNKTLILTEIV